MGSWVESGSAKIAVTSISTISAPPAAPSGFFRQNRHSVAAKLGPPGFAAGTVPTSATLVAMVLSCVPDTRVEPAVEHVDEEVGEDDDDRDEHDERLHDRIVAPENRLHEEAREARQVEDRLGHHEPPDEERELDADHGDHGQQRVLQRVTPHDHALALAFRPR